MKKLLIIFLCLGLFNNHIASGQISGISNNVSCNGSSDGNISITNTGILTPPITYNLVPMIGTQASGTFSNLGSGSYTVQATDANNSTATASFTILEPVLLTLNVDSFNSINCNGGNNGSINVSSIGGTGSSIINLMPGNITNGIGSFTGLTANNYTVTVTDINTCTAQTIVTLSEPTSLVLNIDSIKDATCPNANGAIYSSAIGGTLAYAYSLTPQLGSQTGSNFINIPPATYIVSVTDALGCIDTAQATIDNLSTLNITIDSLDDIICASDSNGAIYIYRWQWWQSGHNRILIHHFS